MNKWWLILVALGSGVAVCCVCAACLFLFTFSGSLPQSPAADVPNDSSTPFGSDSLLTYQQIKAHTIGLTEAKRNDYYKSLIGKTMRGSGEVADVTNSGDVHIRIASLLGYDVNLQGSPKSVSASLNLRDRVVFEGTITEVSDLFGSGNPILTLAAISLERQ